MKPAYRVPTMQEVADTPLNGFKAISTFSGCGGSSLGYKMAGYKLLWASEFIPEAQTIYRANHKGTILDTRDIRAVQPADILKATGLEKGELDLFDGSPPCASFSTAGTRNKDWGKSKEYSGVKQRTDDLFFEYIRLLDGLQPKTFVAENVSGLVKGVAKGYFLNVLSAMKSCGYRVECRLLDAQWLGVPQMRQRTIFVGVRNDLNLMPVHPTPFAYQYTLQDALNTVGGVTMQNVVGNSFSLPENIAPDIARFSIGPMWDQIPVGGTHIKRFNLCRPALSRPCNTVTATGGNPGAASICHPMQKRKFSISELKAICSFPPDFDLRGNDYESQWERLGRAVPPIMMKNIALAVLNGVLRKVE